MPIEPSKSKNGWSPQPVCISVSSSSADQSRFEARKPQSLCSRGLLTIVSGEQQFKSFLLGRCSTCRISPSLKGAQIVARSAGVVVVKRLIS